MADASVSFADGRLSVVGEVGLANVARLLQQSCSQRLDDWTQIDLSGVTNGDSSALALVLEWLAMARVDGQSPTVVGTPDFLRRIAHLSNLDHLLA